MLGWFSADAASASRSKRANAWSSPARSSGRNLSDKAMEAGHNSYAQVWFHFMDDGGIHSRLVPAVGKSQDLLVSRHDGKNRLLGVQAANRSSFACILPEATPAESFREISVSGISADLGNCIHVVRGTDLCRRFVGDEEGCRASSDKNQFTQELL